ncbi:dihydrofolate reductase [Aeromicrobium phragmitis]|uniref:Dihydrofolate reductase n=1 Tax=Aeromicrobium phragmitis TaxID=2478914 RepID=A0A3L8PNT2_9ACTN|nr:dihydrofolate reductase [Aeromicrobium phragmitis]RLV57011.1 dihydrofolate reductase [Aeromicrobium phragmitis]
MTVTLVVAVGENGVIGRDGQMPWPRTGDQVQFKELTWGHPIVMGRATYESIGRPLPGRPSVVLTRDPAWQAPPEVHVVHDIESALATAQTLDDEVFVIGGAQVYEEMRTRRLADRMVVTHVALAPEGDAFFGAIDPDEWLESSRDSYAGYDIAVYERRDLH